MLSPPAWAVSDLPEPPPFTPRSAVRVLGFGAVVLAFSLGAGEWLLGPAVLARYGATILWIAGASVLLQTLLNTEMARYTLYTGEPVFTAFMRTRPGRAFWGWTYGALHFLQSAWPGWALTAATAVAALFLGRVPDKGDRVVVLYFGYLAFLVSILFVLLDEPVGRTREYAERIMTAMILAFLTLIGLFLVPGDVWLAATRGFVAPLLGSRPLPQEVDWLLLAAFAAYSGAGGANATLTYWLRDKGIGMGATVGYLPAVVGGEQVLVDRGGAVFPLSAENLRKWRGWWKYVRADQWWLWAPGSLVGVGLPALLVLAFIEPGTTLGGYGIAAWMGQALGTRYGLLLWVLALLAGFGTLFTTQIGNAEGFARVSTDLLWTASGTVRAWRGGDARALYYSALLALTLWGCVAITLTDPLTLILIGANVAAGNLVLLSFHTLVVNRRFLPRELRPARWREAGLVLCGLFFGGFVLLSLLQQLGLTRP
ncbi:MAG: Nramp family divalent metal transporter, partial [Candidatus Rokubacteria bacterium]|nr:Nramp family divalent metal transporter [Candidatus Rokubacteria bacterium]